MGDGTEKSPFTREDVLRLIKENGGKTVGLDLSGKVFEECIDLSKLDLKGIIFEGAILRGAHFESSALLATHLEGADLSLAHFEGAELFFTYLKGAILWSAEFSIDTRLEDVRWGNYTVGDEKKLGSAAAITYRRLKVWYTNAGYSDIAAKFYYRENEVKRKAIKWRSKLWYHRLAMELSWLLFGYGERWWNILLWIALVVFGSTAAYYLSGELSLPYSLYFSIISFTALGYGQWVNIIPQGWVQALGATESVLGVFLMALFLVTFVRKWTR